MSTLNGAGVLFGGNDGARESDTWLLEGSAWRLVPVLGPSARQNHSMATFP
jgi:hypothetical protein